MIDRSINKYKSDLKPRRRSTTAPIDHTAWLLIALQFTALAIAQEPTNPSPPIPRTNPVPSPAPPLPSVAPPFVAPPATAPPATAPATAPPVTPPPATLPPATPPPTTAPRLRIAPPRSPALTPEEIPVAPRPAAAEFNAQRTRALYQSIQRWLPEGTPTRGENRYLRFFRRRVSNDQYAPISAPRFRPGSRFDPGASGPGVIGTSDNQPFLGGTFDPRSGWPLVILDHFKPDMTRLDQFWIVSTYKVPQEMTLFSWDQLQIRQFNEVGEMVDRDPRDLFAQAAGHTVFVQIHGSLTYADTAIGGGFWSHTWLEINGGLTSDTIFVIFDWPSWRVSSIDVIDINEKARRSYVTGLHLAQFLLSFPLESRVCLLGQSFGGRVVSTALHLLGGGAIADKASDRPVKLARLRPDLHVRAVLLGAAVDHDWFDPGERCDHAIEGCEYLLNLYNTSDEALSMYPFLFRSGRRAAMGRKGLTDRDLERIGPLAERIAQHDLEPIVGRAHTLLDATSDPQVARWIAPYAWSPDPGPVDAKPRKKRLLSPRARRPTQD